MAALWIVRDGIVPYEDALAVQGRIAEARMADAIPDVLLLLEHPPVYTKGRRTSPAELPMGADWYRMQGIEVCETDRGGRLTYHGPGQLVGYPIVSLKPYGDDVQRYVRGLERVMIRALGDWGIDAGCVEGLTGVWVGGAPPEGRKIGSIGVHVSRGVTTHGFAINVNNDLQPFEWVVPCGIEGCRVTSLSRELGAEQDLDAFAATISGRFAEVFEREPVAVEPAGLQAEADGLRALPASAAAVR